MNPGYTVGNGTSSDKYSGYAAHPGGFADSGRFADSGGLAGAGPLSPVNHLRRPYAQQRGAYCAHGRVAATHERRRQLRRTPMTTTITGDQVVEAAQGLSQAEFTRADVAQKLGVEKPDLHKGFKAARKSGRVEKVRDDEQNMGHFRLTDK
jgi:hypothetical protein